MGKEPEVSVGDLEASQRSLERMLDEYKNTWSRGGTAVWRYLNDIKPEDEMENAGLKPMELVLSRFEHEVKRPIRSLVMGDLARLLLIQTQAVKVELEGGIIGIDQVLRQQRLSLAIMALMPSLLAGLLLWTSLSAYVKHLINSRKRLERQQMRLWLAEAERALLTLQSGFGEQRIQEGFLLYALQNLSMSVLNLSPTFLLFVCEADRVYFAHPAVQGCAQAARGVHSRGVAIDSRGHDGARFHCRTFIIEAAHRFAHGPDVRRLLAPIKLHFFVAKLQPSPIFLLLDVLERCNRRRYDYHARRGYVTTYVRNCETGAIQTS